MLFLRLLSVLAIGSAFACHERPHESAATVDGCVEAIGDGRVEVAAGLQRASRFTADDYDRHVAALETRFPLEGFTVVVEEPFVVIGDESPEAVRSRARRTVRWAVDHLKEAFFADDPLHILDVWLFRDEASYEKHAELFLGDRPSTPFGYYSASNRALVMNIATGGGTLVHEIVHPFVEANFPSCPAWFNEGLGSLFEQSAERSGKIVGLTNWRLRGLKDAIRSDDLPTFRELCSMDDAAFYGGRRGDNYAQARYLLYYLQENGRLRDFYRAFHAARGTDPTGYSTLQAILDEDDMTAFQERFEAWVLKLTFP